ncbi:hypothetical protein CDL12_28249 [Handroanthus impetiginosus]|uniref:Putative plant transposon protein domain-containing protein n=1 Tax=Handroanthus impetiginosus TaxID=429701 RepID=A0A2G9G1S6_9LAMI|nr:hypothetical protein CDL12_28249 [Handroanthus impetiginosus]
MVRGKNVNISARAINSLFGTPAINTPGELQEFLKEHPPLNTICELICQDDPYWLNEPIHFSRTKLMIVADNWLRFTSARLLPTIHTFKVTRECVVMIFAILTNVPFDIGRFLHKSIWKSAIGGLTVGLYHLSLITELCAQAGLERQPGDELLQLDSMIRLEERVDRLADEVHHVQLQQEQQLAYQQWWWALWADQMHIPMSNRPSYPPDEPAEPPSADMRDE